MRQKSGKITTGGMVLIAIGVIALFALNVGGIQSLFTPATPSGGTTINTVNPYITVTALDKQASGTSVVVTAKGSFGGEGFKTITLGSDTAVPDQTLSMLLTNNTEYHNAKIDSFVVKPISFPITIYFNKNASVTENMYSTTGVVMSNSYLGGAVNQTKLGNGATYNLKDSMSGTSLASTQDMVCVVEIEEGNNVSTTAGQGVNYDGKAPFSTAKPSWYTYHTGSANTNVYLFEIGALSSGAEVSRNLQIVNKPTGQFTANSTMVKVCYTKEYFVDPNTGKITYDVADSNGALKSMAQYPYQIIFT